MDILTKMKSVFVGMLIIPMITIADDNVINITQSGDNLDLEIEQVGFNNEVGMLDSYSYINNAPNLDMHIVQYNNTSAINKILFDEISGSGNTLKLGQGIAWQGDGSYTYDSIEGGGHYMELDLYGNDNSLTWHQTNAGSTSGHDFNFHLAGDDNDISGRQQGNGVKEMNLTIYNSDNNVTARQKGTWANHTANITLDGLYGTDLLFKQLGSTSLTYSLSVDCVTVGGCAVTVEQGN